MKKIVILFQFLFVTVNNLPVYAQTLACGTSFTLALCEDSTLIAWGRNLNGQLGDGSNFPYSYTPVIVIGISGVVAIACGDEHSLAIKGDGTVWAWGANFAGQLGNGSNNKSNIPVQVAGLNNIVAVAGGGSHSLALKNDSTVWAWGAGYSGALGNGSYNSSNMPVQTSGLTKVIAVAAGTDHSLALTSDGKIWAWGANDLGQLGNGSTSKNNIPVKVDFLSGVTTIAASDLYSIALLNDNTVWNWGINSSGQLGTGSTSYSSTIPVKVTGLSGIKTIAAGYSNSHVQKSDGTVWAWGVNSNGQLGNGSTKDTSSAIKIDLISNVASLVKGGSHTIIKKNNGTLWGWGDNSEGQLGTGDNTARILPVQITGICSTTTASNKIHFSKDVMVFPNPTEGMITVKYNMAEENEISFSIYNLLGEKVFFAYVIKNNTSIKLDLPPGIYIYQLIENEKNIFHSKLTILKK